MQMVDTCRTIASAARAGDSGTRNENRKPPPPPPPPYTAEQFFVNFWEVSVTWRVCKGTRRRLYATLLITPVVAIIKVVMK
jgi:hypothetical protein